MSTQSGSDTSPTCHTEEPTQPSRRWIYDPIAAMNAAPYGDWMEAGWMQDGGGARLPRQARLAGAYLSDALVSPSSEPTRVHSREYQCLFARQVAVAFVCCPSGSADSSQPTNTGRGTDTLTRMASANDQPASSVEIRSFSPDLAIWALCLTRSRACPHRWIDLRLSEALALLAARHVRFGFAVPNDEPASLCTTYRAKNTLSCMRTGSTSGSQEELTCRPR
jgi:hypothetical protein